MLKFDFDSMNETQWETALLNGSANGEGNSMFYVLAKERASGVVVKRNLDCIIHSNVAFWSGSRRMRSMNNS